MIASIVPLLKLARQCDFFDYAIPPTFEHELHIGQLVAISFRNKKVQGIVWNIRENDDTHYSNLKCIDAIVKKKPYISEWQKTFIVWFAHYYGISLARAVYIFIPNQPRRKKTPSLISSIYCPSLASDENADILPQNKLSLSIASDWKRVVSTLFSHCTYIKEEKRQILILTPSVHDAAILYGLLLPLFPNNVLNITSEMPASLLANSYDLIAEEMCTIAISTRQALGWNIPLLKHIIVIDPESRDYKQYDQNPRFSTMAIVDYLVKTRGIHSTLLSFSPSCELIHHSSKKAVSIQTIPEKNRAPVQIVNLREQFRSGNTTFVSDALRDAMEQSLLQSKWVYLFLNRKGYAGLARCSACSFVFICEHCMLPMRFSARSQSLRCTTCQRIEKLPAHCLQCHSHDIRFAGIGIEKISDTAKLLFPHTPCIEISNETDIPKESRLEMQTKSSAHIIIGTSHVFQQHWEFFDRIGCIGIILGDPMQSLIDFRSVEYQWQSLMHLRSIANTFGITTVIQSFEPSSVYIQTLMNSNWQQFCAWQDQQRKRFSWPPYSRLIKIIARHHTALIPNASEMLMKKMRESLGSMKQIITLFRTKNMLTLQRPYFLVRINQEANGIDPLPVELHEFFESISVDWLIDIDPVTF